MVFAGTIWTRGTVFFLNFTTLTNKINSLWKWHRYEHPAHTEHHCTLNTHQCFLISHGFLHKNWDFSRDLCSSYRQKTVGFLQVQQIWVNIWHFFFSYSAAVLALPRTRSYNFHSKEEQSSTINVLILLMHLHWVCSIQCLKTSVALFKIEIMLQYPVALL